MSQCTATVYRDCPNSDHCGDGCEYLEDGIGASGCAWNACSAVTGNGDWQSVCGGIDAVDVQGGCSLEMARGPDGANPFKTIFASGFYGVWKTYENGVHFGDNVGSVTLFCPADGISLCVYKSCFGCTPVVDWSVTGILVKCKV